MFIFYQEAVIKCGVSDDFIGTTGHYRISEDNEETADFSDILPRDYENPENHFTAQLRKLHEASCNLEGTYPWYRCNIEVRGKESTFRYWREDPAITDLSLLEPNVHGSMPMFLFREKFPVALLQQLKPGDYESAFLEFVPRAIENGKQVPQIALGYFALVDWQTDTSNGSLDQYFSREYDCLGGATKRTDLYPQVRDTLKFLDLDDATKLFEEAMALYSHFHDSVNQLRAAMGIAAVPMQTESDIMDRYYDMLEDIESRQWSYFGEHLADFAVE